MSGSSTRTSDGGATPATGATRPTSGASDGRRRAPTGRITPADRARLRVALGRRVDPARSLFGPDSVTWTVNREATLLLGGGRALLLQVAHPLIAAGVAAHSRFMQEPLIRLRRTLDLMLAITFSPAAAAVRAVRQIERVHARVHGVLDQDIGPYPRGTAYDATDPALQLWVHATLVDSALLVFERFVRPLTLAERRRFYDESRIGARLFGIPPALIPPTLGDFRRYVRGMVQGPQLAIGRDGRALAAAVLQPPLLPGLRQIAGAARLFTVGLLPPRLRRRYGLSWSPARERALAAVAAASRRGLPLLPDAIRHVAPARRAAARDAEAQRTRRVRRSA
jgi:uncharacterized protein (DUF2236 family)